MSDNPHETAARLLKASKMADVLGATGITVSNLEEAATGEPELMEQMWLAVAAQASVPKASGTTKALVIELLKNRENARINVYTGKGLFPQAGGDPSA